MPITYDSIARSTLTSSQANIEFLNIPNTYTDLVILITARTDLAGNTTDALNVKFNTDDGSNYSSIYLFGDGSSVTDSAYSSTSRWFISNAELPAINAAADTFGTFVINLQSYSNTTTFKTGLCRFSLISSQTGISTGVWRNTSAINAVTFISRNNANFVAGSTFVIYGVKSA